MARGYVFFSVDDRRIAGGEPGPVTRRRLEEFRKIVEDPANSVPIFA